MLTHILRLRLINPHNFSGSIYRSLHRQCSHFSHTYIRASLGSRFAKLCVLLSRVDILPHFSFVQTLTLVYLNNTVALNCDYRALICWIKYILLLHRYFTFFSLK